MKFADFLDFAVLFNFAWNENMRYFCPLIMCLDQVCVIQYRVFC